MNTVAIDKQEQIPAGLVGCVQILTWKFKPVLVDGKTMRVRSPMSVPITARKVGEDSYSIAMCNASFEGEESAEGETCLGATHPAALSHGPTLLTALRGT
ncbi:MAG: hypothetical protein ABIO17_01970 [Pseudoxanthomonas sp.]